MPLDQLWYLADEAVQQAEQAYHRLAESHEGFLEYERTRYVSRRRFKTLASRVADSGAPYGTHTLVYRPSGELLLVRHEGVDMWVLPGGDLDGSESFQEAARRELSEEAGVPVEYEGLGILTRMRFVAGDHDAWGVMPLFEARATSVETEVSDPDGEISEARWFDDLPADTRDREDLLTWREQKFE